MSKINACAALAALISLGAAHSAPAPSGQADYTADDVVKGFQKPAPTAEPGSQTLDACNPDEDGVCQPKKDSRGFSLEGPAAPVGHASSMALSSSIAPHRAMSAPHQQVAMLTRKAGTSSVPMVAIRHDLLITFKTGSSDLTDRSKANAGVFVQALSRPELAAAMFEIDGHTDATGSADKNTVLSQQRADAVRQFMIAQGADGSRLKAVGMGSDQPINPRDPDAAINRRVEAKRLN